tara:strand:+ start:802 stop:1857 length:1056 start_codon:yes stop_codon:yes gene_type:complete
MSNTQQSDELANRIVPANSSWKKTIIAGVCFGIVITAFLWAADISQIVGMPLLYLIPLLLGLLGLIYGMDSLLVAFLVILTGGAVFLNLLDFSLSVIGFCVPVAIFIGLQDRNIWPEKNSKENENRLRWLLIPDVSQDRVRDGITLIVIAGFYAATFAGTELALLQTGQTTLHGFLLGGIDISTMGEVELQLMQVTASFIQYTPTFVGVLIASWVLVSIKLGMLLIRFVQMTPFPAVVFGQSAIPVWYIILVALLAVVASQTIGETRFICLNTALILTLPALIIGFGVISDVTSLFKYGWLIKWLLFVVLALTATFGSLAIVAILGFLDAPLQIREWLIAKLGPKLEKKYA